MGDSDPLDLRDSALLAKMKGEIEQLKGKIEELEDRLDNEEGDIADDIYAMIDQNAQIVNVDVRDDALVFDLSDDRTISVPVWWSWRLEEATDEERTEYMISEDKQRVVWPELNEEISVLGILTGDPAPRPEEK